MYPGLANAGVTFERRGDGETLAVNPETLPGMRAGDGCEETMYELLADLSLRYLFFEPRRATSCWRLLSRCSEVKFPRGGLAESALE